MASVGVESVLTSKNEAIDFLGAIVSVELDVTFPSLTSLFTNQWSSPLQRIELS